MGKIWLKSPDPNKQCCGCEGKTSPCATCCEFTGVLVGLNIASDNEIVIKDIYHGVDYSRDFSLFPDPPPYPCFPSDQISSSFVTGITKTDIETLIGRSIDTTYTYNVIMGSEAPDNDEFFFDFGWGPTENQLVGYFGGKTITTVDGVNNFAISRSIIKTNRFDFVESPTSINPYSALYFDFHQNVSYTFVSTPTSLVFTFPMRTLQDNNVCNTLDLTNFVCDRLSLLNFTTQSGESLELEYDIFATRRKIGGFQSLSFDTHIQNYTDSQPATFLSTIIRRDGPSDQPRDWLFVPHLDESYSEKTIAINDLVASAISYENKSVLYNTFETGVEKRQQLNENCENYWTTPVGFEPPIFLDHCHWSSGGFTVWCGVGGFGACCNNNIQEFVGSYNHTTIFNFLKSECVNLTINNNNITSLTIRFKNNNGDYVNPLSRMKSINIHTGSFVVCNELP